MNHSNKDEVFSIVSNSTSLTVASAISQFLGFFVNIYIAKTLGAELFGTYNLAIYYSTVFGVISLFGLRNVVIRNVARNPENSTHYFNGSLFIQLLLLPISIGLMGLFFYIFVSESFVVILIITCLILQLSLMDVGESLLFGHELMYISSFLRIGTKFLWCLIIIAFFILNKGIYSFLFAFVFSQFLYIFGSFGILKSKKLITKFFYFPNKDIIKRLFSDGWSFFLLSIFSAIGLQLGAIFLSIFRGNESVGYFSAAHKLLLPFIMVITSFINAIYPVLSRLYNENYQRFKKFIVKAFKFQFIVLFPVCVLVSLYSQKIIQLLYGAQYASSSKILAIYIWDIPFKFIFLLIGTVIAAMNKQYLLPILSGIASIIYAISYIVLIKKYGEMGLALAYIIAGLITMTYHYGTIVKLMGGFNLRIIFKPMFVSILIIILHLFQSKVNYIFLISASIFLYVLLIWIFKVLDKDDKRVIKDLIYMFKE